MNRQVEERYRAMMDDFMQNVLPTIKIESDIRENAHHKFINHGKASEDCELIAGRPGSKALKIAQAV